MPLQENSFKPYSEVVIGSIIYGTIGVFLDKVQDMSVESILFSRLFFGFWMIFIYLLFSRGLGQLKLGKNKRHLLLLGFLNVITGICYFSSIRYSGISVAVLLLYTAPVYVNLLAPRVLGERNDSKNLLPLLFAICGVLLIARPEEVLMDMDTGSNFQKGVLFGLLSGLSFGTTIVTVRYLRHDYSGLAQTFWMTWVSLLVTFPSAISTPVPIFFKNFNILIIFGFTITFAAVIYLKGISGIRAQTGSILALLEPVSGIFFDITALKNPIEISTILGCFLILTAAYMVSSRNLSKRM
jgi:drug/metabolite transporter (DMT)-like permease